jgi:RNA polymerase-binding protein DksA
MWSSISGAIANFPQQCQRVNPSDDYGLIFLRKIMDTSLDLATIKQTLEEERQKLAAFIDNKQTSQHAMEVSNPGSGDRAMDSRNKNRETLLINHVEQQLEDINQALDRLESGTYGICTSCGEKIQAERLDIMPSAALCIDCQRNHDQK